MSVKSAIIATVGSAGILVGAAQDGFAQNASSGTSLDDFASKYALPLDKRVSYYNAGTDTALTEKCTKEDKAIACVLRVMSNRALIDFAQKIVYTPEKSGRVSITVQHMGDREWTRDTYDSAFKKSKNGALIAQWESGNPLAEKTGKSQTLQNEVYKLSLNDADKASVCSNVPVNQQRGFSLCVSFDTASRNVEVSTMTLVQGAGPVSISQRRHFNTYDADYFEEMHRQLGTAKKVYITPEP